MSFSTSSSRNKVFALALAVGVALAPAVASAKVGGGGSFGSRGVRTYSAPPVTNTAPRTAAPMERSASPQYAPSAAAARPAGGMFGGGFSRGLLGGLVGAGLIGMLFGHGLFGGLGDMMSVLGLLVQLALVFMLARFVWNWFQSRQQQPAMAGASPRQTFGDGGPRPVPPTGGFGFGAAAPAGPPATSPLKLDPADFDAFEQRLTAIQLAFGAEDVAKVRSLVTAEMVGHFIEELDENRAKGVVNHIASPKLLQGDLSEAWREGNDEYATVAMRFSLIDTMVDRATGRVVSGDPATPAPSTELWTFQRPRGAGPDAWVLSAIQQA